jgi:RNA polymerase sigma-70 factor (ECF subfamily)
VLDDRRPDAAAPSSADALGPADEVLISRVQGGDTGAFDVLIERYKGKLYATIYHMTSNHEDAADLLQETFLRAYRALPKFKSEAKFSTWCYRIAVNVTINHLRQQRNRQALSLDSFDLDANELEEFRDSSAVHPMESGRAREEELHRLQLALNEAIQSLSEKHRAAVVMHDVQGMTHAQIADILGVPEGTVKTRLFHAHRLLQKKLGRFLKDNRI